MTDSGQNHEFAVKLTLQGPEWSDTAASLKECKALAAMVSASQTVRGGLCYLRGFAFYLSNAPGVRRLR